MEDYQLRVVQEKEALDDKREKLSLFFNNQVFAKLDLAEQGRLQRQKIAMDAYSFALGQRIEHFQTT